MIAEPLYTDSLPDQRRLILEALEASYRHKEAPDLAPFSIEHIMPQTLTEQWHHELGPGAGEMHARLLHVLGNLTLTGYNPELSNSPWADKRQLLLASNLELNKDVAKEAAWGEQQILERGHSLVKRA